MSSKQIMQAIVLERMVRDFKDAVSQAANLTRDISQEGRALGLDFFIRNRGAAVLTVSFDGQVAITVDPGDVYAFNDTKYLRVDVVSAVLFDCQFFGVLIDTLKSRGLMA